MRFGKYDQKIEFISFTKVSDGAGGYSPTEKVDLSTFARITPLKVKADIEQSQMQLPATYRLGVMVRSGFLPMVNSNVKWRGDIYQIVTTPQVDGVRLQKEWIFDIVRADNG